MPNNSPSPSFAALRGHAVVEVTSDGEACMMSERTFSRLHKFRFDTAEHPSMTSSGPRHEGWSVLLVSSSGHSIALCDEHRVGILFPYRGMIEVQHGAHQAQARASQALIVGPGARETRLSRNYFGVLVQVPISQMNALDEAVEDTVSAFVGAKPLHLLSAAEGIAHAHRIIEQVERPSFSPRQPEHWRALLRPLWRALARAERSPRTMVSVPRSLDHVMRAEVMIGRAFRSVISTREVANATGASERSLQKSFRLHRRSTLTAVIAEQRLHAARERLRRAGRGETVTEIAMASGYSHLGRFSQQYRAMFGESPSETLKRQKAGH